MTSGNLLAFGDVRVDLAAERVWRGGELVELEPKAFEVLRHLLHNPDRLVSKQELFDTVWERTAVTDNALTRVVAQLRRAIGDDARDARYVETVPTRGYRFIAPIERLTGAEVTGRTGPAEATARTSAEATARTNAEAADRTNTEATDRTNAEATDPANREGAAPSPEIETLSLGERARVRGPLLWQRLWRTRTVTAAVIGGLITVAAYAFMSRFDGPAQPPQSSSSDLMALASGAPPSYRKDLQGPLTQVTFSLDLDSFPSFSPDGTMLAYSSLQKSKLDLFVRSFAPGSQTRQVTDDGLQNVQPDWSPDGQYLAYHSIARGGIWVVPAAGGTTRQIAEFGSAPRWSPDGRSVVYQSAEVHGLDVGNAIAPSSLWITTFPGGERRPLTKPDTPAGGHGQPAWSSDGTRVVFITQNLGPTEVWMIDVASGALDRVMVCSQNCVTPVLDVDGRALFYTATEPDRGVWRVPLSADGRAAVGRPVALFTPIDTDVEGLALRRDGRQIAFTLQTVRSNLESIALTASPAAKSRAEMPRPQPVTRDTSVRNTWPIVSPDGSRLAYMSRRIGTGRHIWLAALDGTGARQLTFETPVGPMHSWLPEGEEIAYLTARDRLLELKAIALTTGRSRLLRSYGPWTRTERIKLLHARFTPDADQIVLSQIADGVMNLWTQDLKTGALRQLTHDREAAGFPTASADGRWVAYEVMRGGDVHLAIVPYGGGEERVLTSGRGLYWPHSFAPDGDRIALAYRVDGLWRLGAVSRTSGKLEQLSEPVPASSFVRYPAWSPRNDRIIYEHAQVTGNIWMATLRSGSAGATTGTQE
jgi:Tol biopolymer transport system component/DNA-binding winged helix-turn-helix (wHTH) protein